MNFYEIMLEALPSHLSNGENIKKIMKVYAEIFEEIREILAQVEGIGNVESEGVILDLTGQIVGELRQGDNDTIFRNRIKTKMVRLISNGDLETLNGLGRTLLGVNFIAVLERFNADVDAEPAALTLVYNFTQVQDNPTDLFKTAVIGGVSVDNRVQVYVPITGFFTPGLQNITQVTALV